ncbi:MAG: lysophospholipase L1-like esterase [Planctomycetota bacterium]
MLNGGTPSWNSFESLSNLAFRVLPYEPDVVIIYLSTNDAECAIWPDPTFDNRHYRVSWST